MLNPVKRIAVFIDADNVSYKYFQRVLREARSMGEPTIIQAYGNSPVIKKWVKAGDGIHVVERPTPAGTRARNSADISLIIEAVDRANEYDHLCLVTSDADFTLLARHLVDKGKTVTVLGGSRTKKCLRRAVTKFIDLGVPSRVQTATSPPRRSLSEKRAANDNGVGQSPVA
jgi:uncharacterized LabA/DUF88 family protein